MHKLVVDLTGQRFGNLTVIKQVEVDKPGAYWLCRCDCGNEVIKRGNYLRQGLTHCCGRCVADVQKEQRIQTFKKHFGSQVGKRYGRLTVLDDEPVYLDTVYLRCKCDCGNTKLINGRSLIRGYLTTCGCRWGIKNNVPTANITYRPLQTVVTEAVERIKEKEPADSVKYFGNLLAKDGKQYKSGVAGVNKQPFADVWLVKVRVNKSEYFIGRFHSLEDAVTARKMAVSMLLDYLGVVVENNQIVRNEHNIRDLKPHIKKDLTGQRFGKLTVLYSTANKNNRLVWHCKCDCGNEIDVVPQSLQTGRTRSCGCLRKGRKPKNKSVEDL